MRIKANDDQGSNNNIIMRNMKANFNWIRNFTLEDFN